jgi:DNA-binding XRE family transcriptional regulator
MLFSFGETAAGRAMAMGQLEFQPALIDQVHDRVLGAIVDGTLAPGRRLTQEELAEKSGINQATVSYIESGKRIPTLINMVSVLSALDLVLKIETT